LNRPGLNQDLLNQRLAEISRDLAELELFQKYTIEAFLEGKNFAIAEHYLRRALEAVFQIGNHIVSRLYFSLSERPTTYKEIAQSLGKSGILPLEFAHGSLTQMAGYRHRLVHFYHEVTPEEMYEVIQNHLKDFEFFCEKIADLIKNPSIFGINISQKDEKI
jgi:uncharacterized protein YutE (UPF0331/DUF86 family)